MKTKYILVVGNDKTAPQNIADQLQEWSFGSIGTVNDSKARRISL